MNNRTRVLIVDDNEANLELFMNFLEIGGYEYFHAATGEDAIEIVRKEHPDLVLLDIQLPGMDGLAVARILKEDEETKHIKVVALSAYAIRKDEEMLIDDALDGYISKPVSMKEFLKRVKEFTAQCS